MTRRKLLTIILPARNEEANLPRAYAEVTAALGGLACDYEVLVIDNASSDRTGELAGEMCVRDERWRYVRFSRDFNVEASLAAGLRFARGDAALVLFSDLQDPPELIPEFVRCWEAGNDVVYGVVRRREGDSACRTLAARLGYQIIHMLADVDIVPGATDYRLLSRRAIDALNQFDERCRYLRGLAHWIGFKSCAIPYDRRRRTAGRSKAHALFLFGFLANAVTCFSIRPVQLFFLFGALTLSATGCMTVLHLLTDLLPGLTTLHLLLLANLSATLLGTGVLGEYAGRAYIESKRRPLYVVDRTINLDAPSPTAGHRPRLFSPRPRKVGV